MPGAGTDSTVPISNDGSFLEILDVQCSEDRIAIRSIEN